MPTTETVTAQVLDPNDPDVVLLAWCGQNRIAEGGWPNLDREAFTTALVEAALADSGMGLVDDRENPMFPDDDDYHSSLVAYAEALIIQEKAYL